MVDGELKARMAPYKSEKSGKEGDGGNYYSLDYVRRTGIIVGSTAPRSNASNYSQYSNHLTICFIRGETVSAGSTFVQVQRGGMGTVDSRSTLWLEALTPQS